MRKLILISLFAILLGAAAIIWFYTNARPAGTNKEFKNFLIEKGSSASQIGSNLERAGFIKNSLVFKIYVRLTGQESRIFSGEYRLSSAMSLFQIVTQLTKGPLELWVTIPEGLRREEVAVRFAAGLDKDASFTNEFLQASKGKEGTLFPDTYLFPKEASASSIVNKMVRNFESKTSGFVAENDLTFNQRIILASIIERETKTALERPIVAGILLNRIKAGMPLQVDATLQYAVANSKFKISNSKLPDKWWEPLLKEDLSIDSPFNTYKYTGLPPAPIASPGLSSLTAAFNPAQTDFWYYIHDPKGVIHYAKTLEEHNANIAKYLQ